MSASTAITLDWLYARVRQDGECLIWTMHACNNGQDPRARVNNQRINVRRALWALTHNMPVGENNIVRNKCDTLLCVCPEHLVRLTRTQLYTGRKMKMDGKMRLARSIRAKSKLPQEAIPLIKLDQRRYADIAADHGISASMVGYIKNGKVRRDFGGLFAGLGDEAR